MQTDTLIAWYYVAVGAFLLLAQNVVMNNSHAAALAKLKLQHEAELAAASTATLSAMVEPAASAPAEIATAVVPAPVLTRAPAPVEIAVLESRRSQDAVPVAVSFRSEPFNKKGRIVMVSNKSSQKLACQIRVVRPSTGERQTIPLTLPPAGELRVAGGKNWAFHSGDRIEIAHTAYQSLSAAIP